MCVSVYRVCVCVAGVYCVHWHEILAVLYQPYTSQTVRQLGAFQLEPNVTARSTHLVSLEPLRTVNFLRGLIRGLWILRYDWIVQSAAAGRWLPEEPFEVRDFSAAVPVSSKSNRCTWLCPLYT